MSMSLARTFSKAFINNGLSPAGPERAIGSLNEGETFLAVINVYQRLSTDNEIVRPTGDALAGSNGIALSPVRPAGIRARGGWVSATLAMLRATANSRRGHGMASPVLYAR